MKTSLLTVKIDPKLKEDAKQVASDLGLSLSALVIGKLQEAVRSKTVQFSAGEEPSERLIESIRQAEEDRKNGDYYSFDDPKEALAFLDKVREGKIEV